MPGVAVVGNVEVALGDSVSDDGDVVGEGVLGEGVSGDVVTLGDAVATWGGTEPSPALVHPALSSTAITPMNIGAFFMMRYLPGVGGPPC